MGDESFFFQNTFFITVFYNFLIRASDACAELNSQILSKLHILQNESKAIQVAAALATLPGGLGSGSLLRYFAKLRPAKHLLLNT